MVEWLFAFALRSDVINLLGVLSSVIMTLLAMEGPRWDRKNALRLDEHNQRDQLIKQYYTPRPAKELYAIAPLLTLNYTASSLDHAIVARAKKIDTLSPREIEELHQYAETWLNTVGMFALKASLVYRLPLRTFMQTYHLGVIREGMIVLPILVHILANRDANELKENEFSERTHYGIGLIRLAMSYNDTSPIQQRDVYFEHNAIDGRGTVVGPCYRHSRRILSSLPYFIRDTNYYLRRFHILRSRLWLRSLKKVMSV